LPATQPRVFIEIAVLKPESASQRSDPAGGIREKDTGHRLPGESRNARSVTAEQRNHGSIHARRSTRLDHWLRSGFDLEGRLAEAYGFPYTWVGRATGVLGFGGPFPHTFPTISDGGMTYPAATFFSFATGSDHFNDKPMIAVDTGTTSPFRDHVYVAWDAASGGSSAGGIRVGAFADHGATFSITRADGPSGPGRSIGALPFVGTSGQLYVAYNDYGASQIFFNRSLDGGATWGTAHAIATQSLGFQALIPAQSFRARLSRLRRGPLHGQAQGPAGLLLDGRERRREH
jgi:hypothetical protein